MRKKINATIVLLALLIASGPYWLPSWAIRSIGCIICVFGVWDMILMRRELSLFNQFLDDEDDEDDEDFDPSIELAAQAEED